MKLVVSSAELLKAVLLVSKALPPKTFEQILDTYLFILKDNVLTIICSDREITLQTQIPVIECIEEGEMVIPFLQITELLKELPDQPLTIKTKDANSFECVWANGNGCSTLPYFNSTDYPEIKMTLEDTESITIPANAFLCGLSSTIYATSTDAARPIMNGVFFDIKPQGATLVASDMQKLVCYSLEDVKSDEPISFILNKRHASILKSIISKDNEDITIEFDSSRFIIKWGNSIAICCKVIGNYPDYKTIIPYNNSNILKMNRLSLISMVKRISVCSPQAAGIVHLDLAPGSLEITAKDTGFELYAKEKIECDYNGDLLQISFKSGHIIEMLSNMECEDIMIKFADKRRSALILPAEENSKEKLFGIIMPIQS